MGIRAWHILHGVPWSRDKDQLDTLLRGASKLAPSSTRRSLRQPYTREYLSALRPHLDLKDPMDAAVWGVLTVAFFAIARLGELVLPKQGSFDPAQHTTYARVRTDRDRDGREVWVINLPRTKVSATGEDLCFMHQSGTIDPVAALLNHVAVNNPSDDAPLFSHREPGRNGGGSNGRKELTKKSFMARVSQAAKAAKLTPLHGHSLRIGGTLEYMLRGIPFDVVKTMGRWQSDAFRVYLRKHAQILAPYLQEQPEVQTTYARYAMPPVR
ncbi:hypothetical protein EVJ58_g1196 [Rhodofomes roseus]|uniref:Tyr recombinase domain-containing protein n=1 Tax=Rhodofomes roseus TaxID=34475 RepID=A0A4Y9Z2J5_9APHY|nr:hypothetical protein EVJ58_g1196 [Rhodofomes roseus]